MNYKLLLISYLFFFFTPSVFCQNQMSVGNNISIVTYYTTEWTFTDAFRLSDNWLTRSVGGNEWDSNKNSEIPTDANGYPLSIPFTAASDGRQHFVHTVIPCYAKGEYTLVMKGKGRVYFRPPSGAVIHNNLVLTGGTTVRKFTTTADVTPQAMGNIYPIFILEIQESDPTDPIRDIKLIIPNFYDATTQKETEVFHPLFKQRLGHFSLLRFMDFGYTNGSPLQTFSQRTLPTTYTQTGAKGAAVEYMADLANEIQKDMWVCIPHKATDAYVLQVANLLKTRVNAGIKIYIEYSNETWNTLFSQTTYVQDQGQALNLSSDRWLAGQLFVARRSGEIFKIFEDAFGVADRSRLVFVMGTQNGSAWLTQQRLNGLADTTINPGGVRADALSTAPYLSILKTMSNICDGSCVPSVDDLLTEARERITTEAAPTLQTMKTEADRNLMGLICYEGGQHIVGLWEAINNQSLTNNMTLANRDPRMYGIYTDYLTTLKNEGVQMFANFSSCGAWGKYGSWGLLEYQNQDEAVAHKYRAIKDWVAANPYTRDDSPPSVPTNLVAQKTYDASIKLTWTPATDNVGVHAYVVYVNGKIVGLTQETSYLVGNLSPNTTYTMSVRAKDKAFNYSMPAEITAATLAAPTALVVCDFRGTTPSSNPVWSPTSSLSPDITYSGLLRGSGIVPTASINDAYVFSIDGTTTRSTLAESMRDNEYISFKIAPLSNKALNLNDAKANFRFKRLSGASPQFYAVFSSVKGFEAGKEIVTIQHTSDFDTTERNVVFYLPESGYKLLTDTVEFRIYMYGALYARHNAAITHVSLSGFTPTQPFILGHLTTTNLQYNSVHLDWSPIGNTEGFSGYDVFKNGVKINTSPLSTPSFDATDLTENMPYTFVVKAFDALGQILFQTDKSYITTPTRQISYNLLNFNPADATTTLYNQRRFTASGTISSTGFSTDVSSQFLNTSIKAHQFSGGVQVDFAPNAATGSVSAFSLRSGTDGYLPGTLVISADNGINPSRLTALLMWTKDKFNHATANDIVAFDNTNNSQLYFTVNTMATNRALRFVIRNDNTYYLSEKLINLAGTYNLNAFSSNGDIDKRWGIFDPTTLTMPNPLPNFAAVAFNNVQEVGFIYEGSRTAYGHSLVFSNFNVNGLVNPIAVLSSELVSFWGMAQEQQNVLQWQMKNGANVTEFDIERSFDGKMFEKIATQDAVFPNNTYTYQDNVSENSLTYYRLKMNSLDAKTVYSKIISIKNGHTSKVKIYPSVTQADLMIIGAARFEVFNALGILVFEQQNGSENLNLNNYPSGIYIVRGTDTEGGAFVKKIVKQ